MIQIDDSGSGSLIGGTCIGIYRVETNEYDFDIIPVELYDKENFKKKYYLDEVVNIVRNAFERLDVKKNEPIELCQGYMFDRLISWLKQNSYQWKRVQITGTLQNIVEKNFELYAVKLGLPETYIKYTKYPFHFHKLLRWVFADYENRIQVCKVGWKSWSRYGELTPLESSGVIGHSRYYCLKCGKNIQAGSPVRILKYLSNKENLIYLHEEC